MFYILYIYDDQLSILFRQYFIHLTPSKQSAGHLDRQTDTAKFNMHADKTHIALVLGEVMFTQTSSKTTPFPYSTEVQ